MDEQETAALARPPDWTEADEALWRLSHDIEQACVACAALLARWEAGEDLAYGVQRELLREAFEIYRLGRELVAEFGPRR